ncbi:MAG: 3'-5' exonuclease [Chlorobiaceae bacterium]|nr:3'-5' exonuclease [Chlorobiaceae bacterium]
MNKKTLWIDTETTGIEPGKHGIIQLAALIDIAGEVVDEFELKFQPHPGAEINLEALAVTGTEPEELATRGTSVDAYFEFVRWLGKHINKYDRMDKAYPAAFNAHFDFQFLEAWFRLLGNNYGTGSYQNWKFQDPLALLRLLDYTGRLSLLDYKLGTACAHFGIELQAHDALSDVHAARLLHGLLIREVFNGK